jgi:hypothetical protein
MLPISHKMRFWLGCALAASLSALAGVTPRAQVPSGGFIATSPRLSLGQPSETCSTFTVREQRYGWRPLEALADGRPVSFTQDPSLLTADYRGGITLRDFLVAGDVATIRFKPFDPDSTGQETWTRTGVQNIGGRTVSVFNPSWGADRLSAVMRRTNWGFDYPFLYWGEVLPDGVDVGGGYHVRLRFISNAQPAVTVRQAAADVQYSSSVVNIRMDGFSNSRLGADENQFDFAAVTKKFYQHFQDTYDTIAITTQDVNLSTSSAFHVNVKNEVSGIGQEVFNSTADYGSAGRLSSVEMFYSANIATNKTGTHEVAHQWGAYVDWTKLNGLARAGHQPAAHDPLMSGGETYLGSILDGTRRVSGDGGWHIEATPYPILFHPLTLYAMGLVPKEAVPDIVTFDDQGQFLGLPDPRNPDAGTPVGGGTHSTSITKIVGMLGARSGPAPSEWQRAIVIVSNGRLLTQREMDYWTFYAQREADPSRSGVASYDGYVSFDVATGGGIDLKHEIRPLAAGQIVQPLSVDYPNFATNDFRDVVFDGQISSVYRVGQSATFSGKVSATDRNDYFAVIVRLYRTPGAASDIIQTQAAINGNGTFSVTLPPFGPEHVGRYTLQVFLFFPNSGSQTPRVIAGPVTVG